MTSIGIDFGTSNTGVAVYRNGASRLLKLDPTGLKSLGSYIYFQPNNFTGPIIGSKAKQLYYQDVEKGRLLRGIKRALPKKSITKVKIYGKTYLLEELVALILKEVTGFLRANDMFEDSTQFYAGRPSVFSDEKLDNDLALERLTKAYSLAGLKNVTFIEEPVAAAWYYRHQLKPDSTVLFVDVGGGTTDFSLVTYNGIRKEDFMLHGTGGLAIAGQHIDGDLVYENLGPLLGRDLMYETYPGKSGKLSANFYRALMDPDEALKINRPKVFTEISYAINKNANKKPFQNLEYIIQNQLAIYLLEQVETAKISLSENTSDSKIYIDKVLHPFYSTLQKNEFANLIKHSLSAIDKSLNTFLHKMNPYSNKIKFVVLTGGMSQSFVIKNLIQKSVPHAHFLEESTDCITHGLAQWGVYNNVVMK